MIDLDHFKQINDQYGHATGDEVLYALGILLKKNIRTIDIVGRYGGEELLIILPEANIEAVYEAAERLRIKIEHTFAQGSLPAVTVSAGIAVLEDSPDDNFARLVDRADQAMYRAKQAGRNCVRQ